MDKTRVEADMRCVPWPRRKHPDRPDVPTETGGKEARERAEEALRETRKMREQAAAVRNRLDRELARNHFAEAIIATFRGGA